MRTYFIKTAVIFHSQSIWTVLTLLRTHITWSTSWSVITLLIFDAAVCLTTHVKIRRFVYICWLLIKLYKSHSHFFRIPSTSEFDIFMCILIKWKRQHSTSMDRVLDRDIHENEERFSFMVSRAYYLLFSAILYRLKAA